MPLFDMSDDAPWNIREDPVLGGIDLSQEEDILQLSDRQLEAYDALLVRAKRVNQWVEDEGIEPMMNKRLDTAKGKSEGIAQQAMLEVMIGQRDPDFSKFVSKQDPLVLSLRMGQMYHAYSGTIKHIDTSSDYSSGILPEFTEQARVTILAIVKLSLLHTLVYIELCNRMLDRVEHGVPEWDAENGCELDLEPGIPTMGGHIAASTAMKVEEQQADDLVAVRLLSGLFGDDQNWV